MGWFFKVESFEVEEGLDYYKKPYTHVIANVIQVATNTGKQRKGKRVRHCDASYVFSAKQFLLDEIKRTKETLQTLEDYLGSI